MARTKAIYLPTFLLTMTAVKSVSKLVENKSHIRYAFCTVNEILISQDRTHDNSYVLIKARCPQKLARNFFQAKSPAHFFQDPS